MELLCLWLSDLMKLVGIVTLSSWWIYMQYFKCGCLYFDCFTYCVVQYGLSWRYLLYKQHNCIFFLHEAMFIYRFLLSLCVFTMWNMWFFIIYVEVCFLKWREQWAAFIKINIYIYIWTLHFKKCTSKYITKT